MDPVDLTGGIDVARPSPARIYDYLLGGSLNFAADRDAARQLIAMVPDVPLVAQANRAFLRRAVRFLERYSEPLTVHCDRIAACHYG